MIKSLAVFVTLCLVPTIAIAENYRYSGTRHTTHQRIGNQIYSNSQISGTLRKFQPYQSPWSTATKDILHVLDGVLEGKLNAHQAQNRFQFNKTQTQIQEVELARQLLRLQKELVTSGLSELEAFAAIYQFMGWDWPKEKFGTVQLVNDPEPVDQSWAVSPPTTKPMSNLKQNPKRTHNCNIACVDSSSHVHRSLTTPKTKRVEPDYLTRRLNLHEPSAPTSADKTAAHLILGAAGGVLLFGILSAMQ